MKPTLRILSAWAITLLALAFAAVVLLLAFALRIVYETVMLPVHVWRAERCPPALPEVEPDPTCQSWGYEASWPEHVVREDVTFHTESKTFTAGRAREV